jgi:hypothetical protein
MELDTELSYIELYIYIETQFLRKKLDTYKLYVYIDFDI